MATSFNELTSRDGAYIVSELTDHPDGQCREHVILAQDAAIYEPGTVLEDSAGTMIRWAGVNDVAGILFSRRDATDGDVRAVASVWGTSYKIPLLVWADGIDAGMKTAAMTQMKTMRLVGVPAN